MPEYLYRCSACGNKLEVQQKITDEPLKDCPTCTKRRDKYKKNTLHRVPQKVAIKFRGAGFYVNDYAQ